MADENGKENNGDAEKVEDEASEEDMAAAREEMQKMMTSVKDLALSNLYLLSSQAWHHLGLVPMGGMRDAVMDLESARLAIDLYDANLKALEGSLEEEQLKQLRRVLMDLQMNFVNKRDGKN